MTAVGTRELTVSALGTPARQGSKDFKGMRRGKPVLVEADPNLPKWRDAVVKATRSAINLARWQPLDEACEVVIDVFLPRPRSVKRVWPVSQQDGDCDKYVRAVNDALTIAGAWIDDSRCVRVTATKHYARTHPGARITIRPLERTTTP